MTTLLEIERKFDEKFLLQDVNQSLPRPEHIKQFLREAIRDALKAVINYKRHPSVDSNTSWISTILREYYAKEFKILQNQLGEKNFNAYSKWCLSIGDREKLSEEIYIFLRYNISKFMEGE